MGKIKGSYISLEQKEQIKLIIQRSNLTQRDLAKTIGIQPSTLSAKLSSTFSIQRDEATALYEALGSPESLCFLRDFELSCENRQIKRSQGDPWKDIYVDVANRLERAYLLSTPSHRGDIIETLEGLIDKYQQD